jgi:uroporphyrinogen-III synthase
MTSLPDAVLITRPEPGASETARRVAEKGYRPVLAPLLEIRPVRTPLPPSGHLQAILATSGNAIATLPASHRDVPLLAVGDATASRARADGFLQVSSADGDAVALAALAARLCDQHSGPLLFVCGRCQGEGLVSDLRARGFAVLRRVTYATVPADNLPAAAREALLDGELTAALFYSAETSRHLVRLIRAEDLQENVRTVDALAIGERAAVALRELPWRSTCIAARPNQEAMLALLR